jgi:membrane protease YdiL (CAAX protease family)
MTGRKNKADKSTGTKGTLAENIIFVICLIIIALRVTFTEAPSSQSSQIEAAINDTVYSLCLSGTLILTFLIWLVVNIYKGRFSFKPTITAIGLAVFLAGAVVAVIYAANKSPQ